MIERQIARLNNVRVRAEKAVAALNTLEGNPSVLEGLSGDNFLEQAVKVGKISLAVQNGVADFDKPRTKLAPLIQRAGLVEQIGKATEAGAYGEGGGQVLDKALTVFEQSLVNTNKPDEVVPQAPLNEVSTEPSTQLPTTTDIFLQSYGVKTDVPETPEALEQPQVTPTPIGEQLGEMWDLQDQQRHPTEPSQAPAATEPETSEEKVKVKILDTEFESTSRTGKTLNKLAEGTKDSPVDISAIAEVYYAEDIEDGRMTKEEAKAKMAARMSNLRVALGRQNIEIMSNYVPRSGKEAGYWPTLKGSEVAQVGEQVAPEPAESASSLESKTSRVESSTPAETGSRPAKAEREPIMVLGKNINSGGQIRKAIELLAGASENRMVMMSALLNEFFAEDLKAGVDEKILKARLSVILANVRKLLEPEIEVINPIPKGSKDEARYFLRLKGDETSPTTTQVAVEPSQSEEDEAALELGAVTTAEDEIAPGVPSITYLDNLEQRIRAELGEGVDIAKEAPGVISDEAGSGPAWPLLGSGEIETQEVKETLNPRLSDPEQFEFAQVLSSAEPEELAELGIRISGEEMETLLEIRDNLGELPNIREDATNARETLYQKLAAFVKDNEVVFRANEENGEAESLLMLLIGMRHEHELRELFSTAPSEAEKK